VNFGQVLQYLLTANDNSAHNENHQNSIRMWIKKEPTVFTNSL